MICGTDMDWSHKSSPPPSWAFVTHLIFPCCWTTTRGKRTEKSVLNYNLWIFDSGLSTLIFLFLQRSHKTLNAFVHKAAAKLPKQNLISARKSERHFNNFKNKTITKPLTIKSNPKTCKNNFHSDMCQIGRSCGKKRKQNFELLNRWDNKCLGSQQINNLRNLENRKRKVFLFQKIVVEMRISSWVEKASTDSRVVPLLFEITTFLPCNKLSWHKHSFNNVQGWR